MGDMAAVGVILILAVSAPLSWAACHDNPEINNQTYCERKYKVQRHELVGVLRTVEQVTYLCRTYPKYETCLKELTAGCSKYQTFLDMQAYDPESTQIAFTGFCADREIYLRGVSCYAATLHNILNCFGDHGEAREKAIADVEVTKDWNKFYDTFCPFQIEGAKCITTALRNCTAEVQKMMKNVAFSLMHGKCKAAKYGGFQSEYDTKYGSSATIASLYFLSLSLVMLSIILNWL